MQARPRPAFHRLGSGTGAPAPRKELAARIVLVHLSALVCSELYPRLEPLGLERVATSLVDAGHDVRIVDLQVYGHDDHSALVDRFRPDATRMSLDDLANVPEVVDLAKRTRARQPQVKPFAGGRSVSFVAGRVLEHAPGANDAVLRGEGETGAPSSSRRSTTGVSSRSLAP